MILKLTKVETEKEYTKHWHGRIRLKQESQVASKLGNIDN